MLTKKEKGPERSALKQLGILSSRYLKLTLVDKQRFFFIIAQAPIIALLLGLVAERDAFEYYESSKEVIFTIASSAVWIGLLETRYKKLQKKALFISEKERLI